MDEETANEIGLEAYHFLYPLITMDVTRRIMTNHAPNTKPGMGPMNVLNHMRAFPPVNFREVVRPNFDTLYSITFLDLTEEPMIVSAPDTDGSYYLLPMLDMWSDVFSVPGKRTTGTTAFNYLVVPPGWKKTKELPMGLDEEAIISSATLYVWVVGRTQTNGPQDYEAVNKVQDGYRVTPLSQWGTTTTGEPSEQTFVIDPTVDMKTPPLQQVNGMTADKYFAYGAELMKLHPVHITDWSIVARLRRIGLVVGDSFDFNSAPAMVKTALEKAVKDGLVIMQQKLPTMAAVVNGWQMNTDSIGVYGNYYLKRAIVAMVGLGANQPQDAIYPLCVADADGWMGLIATYYTLIKRLFRPWKPFGPLQCTTQTAST